MITRAAAGRESLLGRIHDWESLLKRIERIGIWGKDGEFLHSAHSEAEGHH